MTVLGIMSGTSLDGLDFALCKFQKDDNTYSYEVLKTGFEAYPEHIRMELIQAANDSAYNLIRKHKWYGRIIGNAANAFLKDTVKPDFIASHGHTLFHEPDKKLTFQLGDAASIAAETSCSVISDFRNLDTALNGQGAPLVPIGDKYLFGEYDFCLNLGGFSNISFDKDGIRVAYDICPVNIVLNTLARETGVDYDKNGEIGMKGAVNDDLLQQLNNIPFYSEPYPKSLGREYVEAHFYPLFKKHACSVEDRMRTYYAHAANQIGRSIASFPKGKLLVTGGGAHNKFLISELKNHTHHDIILPDNKIIDFKEAIIFAFLGFLRIIGEPNTLRSVTGALYNSSGGSLFRFPDEYQK